MAAERPPLWEAFQARLGRLGDPHSVRTAALEYLQVLFPACRVEHTPPELQALAQGATRWLPSTAAHRMEGLPLGGESALLNDMALVSGPSTELGAHGAAWLDAIRLASLAQLTKVAELPPHPLEHPVTRLGREPLFHQCVKALASESRLAFHGLFLSIDGFASRAEAGETAGDVFLRRVASLLRDTHPPRSAIFHLSHAFFAVLCLGPTRREYRTLAWDLRNRLLRRGVLLEPPLGISLGVTFWPTDACFPEPFCDLLLRSLERSRRRAANSVVFSEDWYRGPFGGPDK